MCMVDTIVHSESITSWTGSHMPRITLNEAAADRERRLKEDREDYDEVHVGLPVDTRS